MQGADLKNRTLKSYVVGLNFLAMKIVSDGEKSIIANIGTDLSASDLQTFSSHV